MFLFAGFFFFFKSNHSEKMWKTTTSTFQGNISSSSFIAEQLSVLLVVKSWNFTEWYSSKDLTLQVKCIKISPDIIIKTLAAIPVTTANIEHFFVCWDKILEDTVQNNV